MDLTIGTVGAALGLVIRFPGSLPEPYLILSALLPVAWVLSLAVGRAYEMRFLFVGNDEYRRVTNGAVWLVAAALVTAYAVKFDLARGYATVAFSFVAFGTLAGRYLLRKRLHRAREHGRCMYPVLVLGHERAVADFTRQLR